MAGRLWTNEYLEDLSQLTSSQISLVTNPKDTVIDYELGSFEFINEIPLKDWNDANLVVLRAITKSQVTEKFIDFTNYQFAGTILFVILIISLLSLFLFKIVNIPLKSIADSLEKENIAPINNLQNKNNEFGEIARLINDFFKYKESLIEEINTRKKIEAKLIENQNELIKAKEKAEELSKLKSTLLTNLSHEFRTPLSGIIGISELLKDEIDNKEQHRLLNDISHSGKRLHDTLNSILLLAQFESSNINIHKENFNLANEIKFYFENFRYKAEEKNLNLIIDINDRDLYIETDKDLLKQIFYNVYDNAVKFTDKGSINIKLSSKFENNTLFAVIDATDTGIGIKKDNIDIIFNEFRQSSEGFTRKYEGAGLGLTLTKKILNLLNGNILCKSELGIGSTFTIYLPAYKIIDVPNETEHKTKKVKSKLLNILLVEDNPSNQFVFTKYLENIVHVDVAPDGIIALELIKNKKYDMIFMDINLGAGIDGIETRKEIKKIDAYKNIPIAALTGYAMDQDRNYFLSQGFDFFIIKPFSKSDLMDVINNLKSKSK